MKQLMEKFNRERTRYTGNPSGSLGLTAIVVGSVLLVAGCSALRWESDASFKASKARSDTAQAGSDTQPAARRTTPVVAAPLERDPTTGDIIIPSVTEAGGVRRALAASDASQLPGAAAGSGADPSLSGRVTRPAAAYSEHITPDSGHSDSGHSAGTGQASPSGFAGDTVSVIPGPSEQTYFGDAGQDRLTQGRLTQGSAPQQAGHGVVDDGSGGDSWALHLASYRNLENAKMGWQQLQRQNASIAKMIPVVSAIDIPAKGQFYRLKVGPYGSKNDARSGCAALKQRGQYCTVMPYTGTSL